MGVTRPSPDLGCARVCSAELGFYKAPTIVDASPHMDAARLALTALLGVALLLYLVVRRKLHAFLALLLVSVVLGLSAQWPDFQPSLVLDAMQKGMGGTLGYVAIIVGLGAMFGHLLHASGGTQVLADACLRAFGKERTSWALALAGFLISIPVFFDVAFVVLMPLLVSLAKESKRPILSFAIPLLAGLAVTHAFIPPTPGPIGVASILEADLGYVILFGFIAAVPSVILSGPVLAKVLEKRVAAAPLEEPPAPAVPIDVQPALGRILFLIGLPIALILIGTTTTTLVPAAGAATGVGSVTRSLAQLLGHPFVALLLTTLLSARWLGRARGLSPSAVSELMSKALEPAGLILLITGAGGVLKQVMIDTNVGKLLAEGLVGAGFGPLVIAFFVALLVRVMQGSATVAMLTAAGLVAPLLDAMDPSPAYRALLVLPIASGATALSHVNDSGFWLVSRYLGLDVPQTLKSWTLMTSVAGVVGFGVSLLLSVFVD